VFLIFYLFVQYPHLCLWSLISLCNTLIMYGLTFIQNINFHIMFFVFVILVLDVVASPLVIIEGVHWAKDGSKFACSVDGCDVSYMAKYNLVWHLRVQHNVVMKSGKPKHPSTPNEGPMLQDQMAMNVWVLSNLLARFHCNEQKAMGSEACKLGMG